MVIMKYAVDSKQMKEIDQYTIDQIKIPAMVLMERAAYAVAEKVKEKVNKSDRILVICGAGNNGGDGIAIGRILYLQGYQVAILFLGEEEKSTEQTKAQLSIAMNLKIRMENNYKPDEYNIIIDAIFGVGLTREVTGIWKEIIRSMNASDATVFSVDLPSGISADDGKVLGIAVKANFTITFGYHKRGLLLYPGKEYAGEVSVADIGFPECAAEKIKRNCFYFDQEDLKQIPLRADYSNKGTYGRVLIIAGNKEISGAAYLSAKAAYKSGAGLVKILTAEENRVVLQSLLPEALFASYSKLPLDGEEIPNELLNLLSWASVVVLGPGLGTDEFAERFVWKVITNTKSMLILDADAITLIGKRLDEKYILDTTDRIKELQKLLPDKTILTPHLKELSVLLRKTIPDIAHNLIDTADQCSYNSNLIYAIKDARSIVSYDNQLYLNVSGNNGMATGGSGDVLTGIIAAMIAQGMKPYEATCLAVYIHGLAGDEAAKRMGRYSLLASDIIDSLQWVFQKRIASL
ncbi:MAG: hypothetical protein K0S47_3253 [Herbinix sp.]|nr:hypothetical protein [Herbinix sp.]